MKKVKNNLPDKIVILNILYVACVIAALCIIFAIDRYTYLRVAHITKLHNNEESRRHLNETLQKNISEIRTVMLGYSGAYSYKDMDRYEQKLKFITDEISEILLVLEKGGEYKEKLRLSKNGADNVLFTISYDDLKNERYSPEILDLRAKIVQLDEYTDILRNLLIDSITLRQLDRFENIENIRSGINDTVQEMEHFFDELNISSRTMYLEAESSSNKINTYLDREYRKFRTVKMFTNLLLGTMLGLSGIIISFLIYRTVKARNIFSEKLNSLNASLEKTVGARTDDLEKEMMIRRQKEQESREKAQFMTEVIESLAHPFYVIDAATYEIVLANSAAYEIIGGRGKTCYELTHHLNHPCDGIDHPCPLKIVKDTCAPAKVEHIHIVRNSEKRYFEVHGYPVKDKDGNVIQMIEYSLDITDRKDAEFALMNLNSRLEEKVAEKIKLIEKEIKQRKHAEDHINIREKHFRELISNISDIIIILDRNMRMIYLSPSVEKIIEYSPDQLLGKSFEDIIHSRERNVFSIWMERILNRVEEDRIIELRLQKSSGSWINGEILAKNMLDNEIINGIVINIRDITARKRAEDQIRKLSLIMEHSQNSIIVTDPDGNIEYVNPAFENLTGYTLSEVIGQKPGILKSEQSVSETFDELWACISKGKVWRGEFINKKKNGELYTENAVIAPLVNDRGEIFGYIGMKENITELKNAREHNRKGNWPKPAFLVNMSHEIKTPLNSIIGFLDLLHDTRLDPDQLEYLNTVKSSTESLMVVMNNILDMIRIESGMLVIENAELDLKHNIFNTVKSYFAQAEDCGVTVSTDVDENIPEVLLCDQLRINQILKNLLCNAVKFTKKGGNVKLTAKLLEETEMSARVLISVQDTGVGIPPEKLDSVFESFAQADDSATRKYEGVGLGLTITKELLKLMNSEINVESEQDKGSRFYFELLLEKPSGGSSAAEHTAGEPDCFTGKVLLAEDNPASMQEMDEKLRRLGIEPVKTENGLEALELAASTKFDLVIMDISMPQMDGATAVRRLREYEKSNYKERTPVIALVSHSAGNGQVKYLDSDFDGILSKPADMKELADAAEKFLSKTEKTSSESFDYASAVTEIGLPADSVRELMTGFVQQAESDMSVIIDLLENNGYEKIKSLAYSYKGTADNLRLIPFSDIFSSMDKSARLKNREDIINDLSRLEAELLKLKLFTDGE